MKTREKIIHTSLALFNEQGERNITTNHIANYLNISPGNLYYHFRNKEDIIRSIFDLYEHHLESAFQPYEDETVTIELLIGYFDAMFYALWKFRFMYTNLEGILARDNELKQRYQDIQQQMLTRSSYLLHQLVDDGFLSIDTGKITPLADTIKMIASFWISYQLTQAFSPNITKATLYEGVLRVIMIFKAYSTPTSIETFKRLEHHYHALALK